MTDRSFLLCLRVADADPRHVIPGSVKSVCSMCGSPVLISPASMNAKNQISADVVCLQCSSEYVRKYANGGTVATFFTEEQVEEAEKTEEKRREGIRNN